MDSSTMDETVSYIQDRISKSEFLQHVVVNAAKLVHMQKDHILAESISIKARKLKNQADPSITLGWQQRQTVTQISGHTQGDLIVVFDAEPAVVGRIVDVFIERAAPLTLFGRLVDRTPSPFA